MSVRGKGKQTKLQDLAVLHQLLVSCPHDEKTPCYLSFKKLNITVAPEQCQEKRVQKKMYDNSTRIQDNLEI